MTREPMDDLDLLYARLEPVAVPPDFVARVMARVRQREARAMRWRRVAWLTADLVAALVLTWAGFSVGRVLALGAFEYGGASQLFDLDLALAAPGAWLVAVGELAPLAALVCLIAAAVVVVVATRVLLNGSLRDVRTVS
jgi:uncharacterized membrane protein YphA (DoxX/SURF4 family)